MSDKIRQDKIISASIHKTVLLKESIDNLKLEKGDVFFDGTLGGGGHSEKVCIDFGPEIHIVGVDRDILAIERTKKKLSRYDCKKDFVLSNYRNIDKVLSMLKIDQIDAVILDLGLSSDQFEVSGRGFTFKENEPLLMTFSSGNEDITAERIINEWSEETIADILYGYADERFSKRISKKIVEERIKKPIKTTFDLIEVIREAVPQKYINGKIHFATKTFQALRIAVNDEIESLKDGLQKSFQYLKEGGRIAVISFHSTEDRVVKNFFRDKKNNGLAILITKKPITPSEEEVVSNPRSRSAKLRILEKYKR